jgi:hypothetical protein
MKADQLALLLAQYMAMGKLDAKQARPAVEALSGESKPDQAETLSLTALIAALENSQIPAVEDLRKDLLQKQLETAGVFYRQRSVNPQVSLTDWDTWPDLAHLPTPPLDWLNLEGLLVQAKQISRLLRDLKFLGQSDLELTDLEKTISDELASSMAVFSNQPDRWHHLLPGWDNISGPLKKLLAARKNSSKQALKIALQNAPETPSPDIDEAGLLKLINQEFHNAATSRRRQSDLLDLALSLPCDAVAEALPALCTDSWAQERAMLLLTLRFGRTDLQDWATWSRWLADVSKQRIIRQDAFRAFVSAHSSVLLYIWWQEQGISNSEVETQFSQLLETSISEVTLTAIIQRWRSRLTLDDKSKIPEEQLNYIPPVARVISSPSPSSDSGPAEENQALPPVAKLITSPAASGPPESQKVIPSTIDKIYTQSPPPVPVPATPAGLFGATVEATVKPPKKAEVLPPKPAPPSVWQKHIQPFLFENWYLVAGLAMVLVGASLLAYFTWDKHWILRYTIMPLLLAGFTLGLGTVGGWLQRKFKVLKQTGVMLRGAAIVLMPVNFMVLALACKDEIVSPKAVVIPLMAAAYFAVFGWALRRWCHQIAPGLKNSLAPILLLINALVGLAPLYSSSVGSMVSDPNSVLVGGFYCGMVAAALFAGWFFSRLLTEKMLRERFIPWFFGISLTITFLEVFAWVHWSSEVIPTPAHYSIMLILTAGLIFYIEKHLARLRKTEQSYGGETFVAYACLSLGLLMGMTSPEVRVASLLLAGILWIYQASLRPGKGNIHNGIGLCLLMLGAAAVGLLEGFPKNKELNALPALGLLTALLFRITQSIASRCGKEKLSAAARDILPAVLVITACVTVLSQWLYGSEALDAGLALLVAAAAFCWRAEKYTSRSAVYTAMSLIALALPYLGFADMNNQLMFGNNMVFALSSLGVLWLVFLWIRPVRPWISTRSTVLLGLGSLACAAMLLKLIFESGTPGILPVFRQVFDLSGPLLIVIVLGFGTYFSRSLLPAILAAIIAAVLFPELRSNLRQFIPQLSWGSGLGSACAGLVLAVLCIPIRCWPLLKNMSPGDNLFADTPFPLKRFDHSLFTWPMLATALFLTAKVDSVNLWRNLSIDKLFFSVPLKTNIALTVTAATWILLAATLRKRLLGWIGVLLSSMALLTSLLLFDTHPFLITGITLHLLCITYRILRKYHPWISDVLLAPTRFILAEGTLLLTLALSTLILMDRAPGNQLWLSIFVIFELLWHSVRKPNSHRFGIGIVLLSIATLVNLGCPHFDTENILATFIPAMLLAFGFEALNLLVEIKPLLQKKIKALLRALHWGSILLMLMGFFFLLRHAFPDFIRPTELQQILLVVLGLLIARAHSSSTILLLVLVASHFFVHCRYLDTQHENFGFAEVLSPWRLGLSALIFTAIAETGRRLPESFKILTRSRLEIIRSRIPGRLPLFAAAIVAAGTATVMTAKLPLETLTFIQLWGPYLAAASLVAIGLSWRNIVFLALGAAALTTGNVQTIRYYFEARLLAVGLSATHIFCLGLVFTLLQGTLLSIVLRRKTVSRRITQVSLILAGMILLALSLHYFLRSDLTGISLYRFLISGLSAYAAGWYFRWAARRIFPAETMWSNFCESVYHYAVTVAIWSLTLMIPWLRTPATALLAISIPPIYFWIRAESGFRSAIQKIQLKAKHYRDSAAALSFLLLGLYGARAIFQMILFPSEGMTPDHYHTNAPVAIILGLLLLRLGSLGASDWTAIYGGIAVAVGSFFCISGGPGLSPFSSPIAPAAWVAVITAHLFMIIITQPSFVRSLLQRFSGQVDEKWKNLSLIWGHFLLWAAQLVVLLAIWEWSDHPLAVAPLLVASASLFIHLGGLRNNKYYLASAGLLLLTALHADFLLPSYLTRSHVICVILLLWGCFTLADEILRKKLSHLNQLVISGFFLCLTLAQVIYHQPWSLTSLLAMILAGFLWSLTPALLRKDSENVRPISAGAQPLILWIPWLLYFIQVRNTGLGLDGLIQFRPVLTAIFSLLVTGSAAFACQTLWAARIDSWTTDRYRLYHSFIFWMRDRGQAIMPVILWMVTPLTGALLIYFHNRACNQWEVVSVMILLAGTSCAWFLSARRKPSLFANYLGQICAAGLFIFLRRQLTLTDTWWNAHYDIWFSLAISAGIVSCKQWLDTQQKHFRRSMLSSMLLLPLLALCWALFQKLGSDVILVILGIHSLLFSFLGHKQRTSSYNVLALGGFVTFVTVLFWQKLELRVINAYIIPVGIASLVMVQLFGKNMQARVRNSIRLVALLAMLGSSAYYALLDSSYPIHFHVTLLILGLAAMVLGSFLRLKLYLVLGCATILVDLAALFYKMVIRMEKTFQMTVIGVLLLLLGIAVVGGSAYYKTQRQTIDAWIKRLRERLGVWE